MKKRIPLSIIVNAIEETFGGWRQFYNVETGEIVSVPDSDNAYVDTSEYAELLEQIDESDLYIRLPSQDDLHEYDIMEAFAEEQNDDRLMRALNGRKPFRSFKDTALNQGVIDQYYSFRSTAYARIAREWCEENEIPFFEDVLQKEEQIITITVKTKGDICEMNDDEIRNWYETNIARLFNPECGQPEITVEVKRIKY